MKYRWKLAKHLTLYEKYFKLEEISVSHELFGGGFSGGGGGFKTGGGF